MSFGGFTVSHTALNAFLHALQPTPKYPFDMNHKGSISHMDQHDKKPLFDQCW